MLALDAEGNTPRHHAGPPFDAAHQRRLFAALGSASDASLDYLRDLTRSADRLVEFFELFFCGRAAAQAAVTRAARTHRIVDYCGVLMLPRSGGAARCEKFAVRVL